MQHCQHNFLPNMDLLYSKIASEDASAVGHDCSTTERAFPAQPSQKVWFDENLNQSLCCRASSNQDERGRCTGGQFMNNATHPSIDLNSHAANLLRVHTCVVFPLPHPRPRPTNGAERSKRRRSTSHEAQRRVEGDATPQNGGGDATKWCEWPACARRSAHETQL